MRSGVPSSATITRTARTTRRAGLTGRCVEKHSDVHRFLRLLIDRRRLRSPDAEQHHLSLNQLLARALKTWHGVKIGQPDWSSSSHSIALSAHLPHENVITHLIFNAYWEPLEFELPRRQSRTLEKMDRYRARRAERHRAVAGRAHCSGFQVYGRAALRCRPAHRGGVGQALSPAKFLTSLGWQRVPWRRHSCLPRPDSSGRLSR